MANTAVSNTPSLPNTGYGQTPLPSDTTKETVKQWAEVWCLCLEESKDITDTVA